MFAFILCVASTHVPVQSPQKKKTKLLRNTRLPTHCSDVASFQCCSVYNKTRIIHGSMCMLSMLHGSSYGTVDKRGHTYSACEYISVQRHCRGVGFGASRRMFLFQFRFGRTTTRGKFKTIIGENAELQTMAKYARSRAKDFSCRSFYSKINAVKLRHFAMPWI